MIKVTESLLEMKEKNLYNDEKSGVEVSSARYEDGDTPSRNVNIYESCAERDGRRNASMPICVVGQERGGPFGLLGGA